MEWSKYHWQQDSEGAGSWEVLLATDTLSVDVTDCGCCGSIEVISQVSSVEDFDRRWAEAGSMIRTRVLEALEVRDERA